MFQFSLAALHKVRTREEEKKQKEFAHIANALQEESERKKGYEQDIINSLETLGKEYHNQHYDPSTALLFYQYGVGRKIAVRQQEMKIEQINEALEIKRKEMLQAHIKRKVLDNFRDRKEEQFNKEQERIEEKEISDIVSCRYAMQKNEKKEG